MLVMLGSGVVSAQPRISLSPPQVEADSVFFEEAAAVRLELDYPGVQLRYTLDDSPVVPGSLLYEGPLHLAQTAVVRARAFHEDFADSPEVALTIRSLKQDHPVKVVAAQPAPSSRYSGAGLPALTDRQKGALNFAASPEAWLGWETDTLHLMLELDTPTAANRLTLSLLDDAGAWIMKPALVQVYESGELVGEATVSPPAAAAPTRHTFLEVALPPRRYEHLHILVCSRELPEWHDGAGRPAWIFLDEIFLSQISR